jgi:hypothetical protein
VFTATPELDYRLVKGSGIHAEPPSFEAADVNIPGGCEYMQKLLLCKTVEYFDPNVILYLKVLAFGCRGHKVRRSPLNSNFSSHSTCNACLA